MTKKLRTIVVIAAMSVTLLCLNAAAQTTASVTAGGETSKKLTRLVVSGNATVQAQPDTANLTISVVTQSKRALDAQTENARKTDEVVKVVKTAVGAGGRSQNERLQSHAATKLSRRPTAAHHGLRSAQQHQRDDDRFATRRGGC